MLYKWLTARGLGDVDVVFADLPAGLLGYCDHRESRIYIHKALRQRQALSVLAHEIQHLKRGPVPALFAAREEHACDVGAAHDLIPLHALAEALRWTRDRFELADELHVSVDVVECRVNHLHPSERAYLRQRLAFLSGPDESVEL